MGPPSTRHSRQKQFSGAGLGVTFAGGYRFPVIPTAGTMDFAAMAPSY